MRRATRVSQSTFDAICTRTRTASYTHIAPVPRCTACLQSSYRFSTSTHSSASFSDRIRSRLWKKDKAQEETDPDGQFRQNASAQDEQAAEGTEEPLSDLMDSESPAYKEAMKTYQPASTWDDLNQIGGQDGWWKENWDPEHVFTSWKGKTKMNTTNEVAPTLRRAVIEILVLQSAGKSTTATLVNGRDFTQQAQIIQSEAGPILEFKESTTREDIINSLIYEDSSYQETVVDVGEISTNPTEAEEATNADRSTEDPLESVHVSTQIASWDPIWLQISLQDPVFKFAVFKRTSQLTGIRLADSIINNIESVQDALSYLVTPAKPRTIIESLSQKKDLLELPNVTVLSRRWTPIDKEVSVGRWKVIEKELQAKGLPIMGKAENRMKLKLRDF